MTSVIKYSIVRHREVYIITHLRNWSFYYDGTPKEKPTAFKVRKLKTHNQEFSASNLPFDVRIYLRDLLDN